MTVNSPESSASSTSTVLPHAIMLTENQRIAFRANLESELAEVRGLGAQFRAEISASLESRRSTSTESEDSEGSALAFEGAQTTAMMEQVSRHADEIVTALTRIDKGTYGTCMECGSRIATGRLEARPASALCIECAS
jgi:DnaK suppressor protein